MLRRQKEVQAENKITFYTINRLHIEHTNEQITKDELTSIASLINQTPLDELNNNHQNNFQTEPINTRTGDFDESDDEKRISNSSNSSDYYLTTGSNIVQLIENILRLMTTYSNAFFRKLIYFIRIKSNESDQNLNENCVTSSTTPNSSINNQQNSNQQISTKQVDCSSSFETNNNSSNQNDSNHQSLFINHQSISTIISENSLLQNQQHHPATGDLQNSQELISDSLSSKDKMKKAKQENKSEIKKLKADLQSVRQSESEFKDKFNKMQVNRNELKFQCSKLQHDNTALQTKLQNFLNTKQQDKNLITDLEKKLLDERKIRNQLEKQISKFSKVVECGEICKQRRIDFDDSINKLRDEIRLKDLQIMKINEDNMNNKQILLTAIEKMQSRTQQLEQNLKEETKLKLELFSVLGETRRQLEMNQIILFKKSTEVEELNTKISELMAVLPGQDPYGSYSNSIFLPNFIRPLSNSGNDSKQSQIETNSVVGSGSSVLKNSIQSLNNSTNLQSTADLNLSNLSNSISNCNKSISPTQSSNAKGSLSNWKNLNHSFQTESTSGDLTPKNSTNSSDL